MAKITKTSHVLYRYLFALSVILLGLVLDFFNKGSEFLGFSSVGFWLIYVGIVMLAIITLQTFAKKKRLVDERMMLIAHKASRMTFLFLVVGAFLVMILDGINPITVPYSISMSYLIAFMMIVYFLSYKILEKYN